MWICIKNVINNVIMLRFAIEMFGKAVGLGDGEVRIFRRCTRDFTRFS